MDDNKLSFEGFREDTDVLYQDKTIAFICEDNEDAWFEITTPQNKESLRVIQVTLACECVATFVCEANDDIEVFIKRNIIDKYFKETC